MAQCKECGDNVVWATLANGKDAGKKRPFDPDASQSGRYGITPLDEKDRYGNQMLEATYFKDPLEGLEKFDELFNNHFFTCRNKKKGGSGGGGAKVFVLVQIGGDDYSGYVSKVAKGDGASEPSGRGSLGEESESPF